jgi:hypothetical protein
MKTLKKKVVNPESEQKQSNALIWASVSARLMGFGSLERNAELSASGKRIRLPDQYTDKAQGFRDLLDGTVWVLLVRAADYLVAIPLDLFQQYVNILYEEKCEAAGLSAESFATLYLDRSQRVWTDKRYRWRICAAISKELHHEGNKCPLVFQTRGPTIEIRTRSRHFKELRSAEAEAEELRQKASALKCPDITQSQKSTPKPARFSGSETVKS